MPAEASSGQPGFYVMGTTMKSISALFSPPLLSCRASLGLLPLRCVAGLAMMFHGWGKIQAPFGWMGPDAATHGLLQALAAVSEFGGGLAWILGLLTPITSLGIGCTMVVATWSHAVTQGQAFVGRGGSYELPLVYLMVSILFLLAGPGRFSLDRALFKQKS